MANYHSIKGTTQESFSVGKGTPGSKTFYAGVGDANNPGIRWNADLGRWETSTDDAYWVPIAGGSVDLNAVVMEVSGAMVYIGDGDVVLRG